MNALGGSPARVFASWVMEAVIIGALTIPAATMLAWMLLRTVQALDNGEVSRWQTQH
jgi:hypothetical protein